MHKLADRLKAMARNRREYALTNLPAHLHKAGDAQRLFELVGKDIFRGQQLNWFDRPMMITEGIDYAVDMAVQCHDLGQLIRFSMLRINDTTKWFKADLFRFVTIARDHPQRAWEIATLIPDPALSRIALVLLSWLLFRDEGKREFVCKLVTDAANVCAPATIGQTPVLLEMTKELFCTGFDQAKMWIRTIPNSPVRQMYQTAWEHGQESVRSLAAEMIAVAPYVHESPAEETTEFSRMQEIVQQLEGRLSKGMSPSIFEERLFELFGPSGVSDAYFLMAAERIQSGDFQVAHILINRGIYQGCSLSLPAIRTLSALAEMFGNTGDRDLAEEHASRVRIMSRMLERIAKKEQDFGRLQDAFSELRIATDNLAHTWRPSGAAALFEQSLANQRLPGQEGKPDALIHLANARQLLAAGHIGSIPVLGDIFERLAEGESGTLSTAILISVYAMAHVCRDDPLISKCAAQLHGQGLFIEYFYLPQDGSEHALAVLKLLVGSDPRCVASVSLCLRLERLDYRLLEFVQVASNSGAGIEILDAILSQVVRLPGISPVDLRLISESILKTTAKPIHIPSGLGWYYYPGVMLLAAWSGVVMVSVGLRAALAVPKLLAIGVILALAELIGGSIDLIIWRFIGMWEKPELSRRLFLPELASLASPWLVLFLLRPWLESVEHTSIGIGALVALSLSLLLGIIVGKRGLLFIHLSKRVITLGTATSFAIAGVLGIFLPVLLDHLVLSAIWGGIFLTGMLEIGICLNIAPKRIAVLRYYRERESEEESSSEEV